MLINGRHEMLCCVGVQPKRLMLLSSLRLWSIGVGSVIGGDFFGWNSTLHGGFGACLIALFLNAIMFGILAHCTTKLSTRIPKGGAYRFVCHGIDQWTGLLIAALELIKLFWVLSALCFGLTDYLYMLINFPLELQFLCYPILFIIFASLGMSGVRTSGNIQIFITCGCLLVLLFFWISVSTKFNFYTHAIPDNSWINSWRSVLIAIPYGSWLFLGFEELPLIQIEEEEEKHHEVDNFILSPSITSSTAVISTSLTSNDIHLKNRNKKVMFNGIVASFFTVFVSGMLTVTLSSSSEPGVDTLRGETSPLLSGIEEVYGKHNPVTILFGILSLLSLFAPCYSFMLYCSEHIQVRVYLLD